VDLTGAQQYQYSQVSAWPFGLGGLRAVLLVI
jgi:hypothetical protein